MVNGQLVGRITHKVQLVIDVWNGRAEFWGIMPSARGDWYYLKLVPEVSLTVGHLLNVYWQFGWCKWGCKPGIHTTNDMFIEMRE